MKKNKKSEAAGPSRVKPGRSMHDVAAIAGVSSSAVSLALRHHPSIPTATRERVEKAAAQIGYRKSPLVAALMRQRRSPRKIDSIQSSLAFLTSDLPRDRWRDGVTSRNFFTAAAARATERSYSLDEFSLSAPNMRPARLAELLRARGIHGVLVAPLPGRQTSLDFDFSEFAVVGLGTSVSLPLIDRIADDHFYAAKLAYEECHALGYRRIGLALTASISRRLEHRWWSGYLVAQQQLAAHAPLPALMPETRDEIPPLLNGWIARHRLDSVIFALRDETRMGCAPPQVGLVSLSAHGIDGKVAGIMQDEAHVGAGAIDLLVEKLNRWDTGPAARPRLQLIRGTWIAGASAPGAGRDRTALLSDPAKSCVTPRPRPAQR